MHLTVLCDISIIVDFVVFERFSSFLRVKPEGKKLWKLKKNAKSIQNQGYNETKNSVYYQMRTKITKYIKTIGIFISKKFQTNNIWLTDWFHVRSKIFH